MTFTRALGTNNYGPAKFIVDGTTTANGTHSTIATALTSASSGDTIFIRPGTYTENLTLKAGVNITSFTREGEDPNVTIVGNCTATFAGTCTISNIRLQTNSASLLTVSGNSATIVKVMGCFINVTNATGITFSTSSGSALITLRECFISVTSTFAMYSQTSAGNMQFQYCVVDGGSSVANNISAGAVSFTYTYGTFAISSSSTGLIVADYAIINAGPFNVAAVTTAGTGSAQLLMSEISGGSASAISVGSGTTANVHGCRISSSNTNAITGAGTLVYTGLIFTDTSSTINVTTQTASISKPGITISNKQPAFYAYLPSNLNTATGDGTTVTLGGGTALTEVYDQNNNFVTSGTFTAPYTGIYSFVVNVQVSGITAAMTTGLIKIVATGTTYTLYDGQPGKFADNGNILALNLAATIAMTAADTCTFTVQFSNGTKAANIVGANGATWVSGHMLC